MIIVLTFDCRNPTSEFLDFAMIAPETVSNEAIDVELSPEVEFAILRLRSFLNRRISKAFSPAAPMRFTRPR